MNELKNISLYEEKLNFYYEHRAEILPFLVEAYTRTTHSDLENYLPLKKNLFTVILVKKGTIALFLKEKTQNNLIINEDESCVILPNSSFSYKSLSDYLDIDIVNFGITYPHLYSQRKEDENIWIPFNLKELFALAKFDMGRSLPNKSAYLLSQNAKDLALDILIKQILYEFSQEYFVSNWMLHGYAYQLLAIIVRSLHTDSHKNVLILQGKVDELIEIAKKYIIDNYREELSMEQIASQVYLSQGYFSNLFKSYVGITPKSFLTQIRLSKACELLESEEININSIAKAVGFKSSQRMNIIFKKFIGDTPIKYRMNYKNKTKR